MTYPALENMYDSKTYLSSDNTSISVIRLSEHIRVFNVWNASLDNIKSVTLDTIDRPSITADSPLFMTDAGKMGRIRLNTSGTIAGWIMSTYGGTSVTSDSIGLFIQFFYVI